MNKVRKAPIIAAIQQEAIMGRPRELTAEERRQLISDGYRPVEIWVPDLSDPNLLARAEAEAKRIAKADQDEDIVDWIEAIQQDMWEGEDRR
ncbi:MAG: antitoxin MazE family protein [Pseudomonadota bacterium]|nr:antitoxin MazE family protein [Pseudomonadota bacterium]